MNVHYEKLVPLCDGKRSSKEIAALTGLSQKYVQKLLLRYDLPRLRRGDASQMEKNHFWKGGRIRDKSGYVLIKATHPHANSQGYVREHKLVMEQHLGRYLKPGEVVHHKNGKRSDNRIENLELFQQNGEHLKAELTGRCPKWSPEGRARILKAVRAPRVRKVSSTRRESKTDARRSRLSSLPESQL